MKSIDFNLCHPRSRELAERLHNRFRNPEICWGAFIPTTPISSWDERWINLFERNPNSYAMGFVHFWVECQGRIWDRSLAQFGETGLVIAKLNDPRYDKYGIESLLGSRHKYPGTPNVIWDAFPEFSLKD